MKILIATPTFDGNVSTETMKSIFDLNKGRHQVKWEPVRGYDCARARNIMAQKALDMKADYLLMVDADNILPADALINLLEGQPKVALGYCMRKPRKDPIYNGKTSIYRIHTLDFPIADAYSVEELEEMAAKGETKIKVHGGGAAIMLINTAVFHTIPFPWFEWRNYKSGTVLSEDLDFCVKCMNHDIPILVDCRVKCGHIIKEVR